jgi:hypothetical protein
MEDHAMTIREMALGFAVLVVAAVSVARAETRVALVIGNSAYTEVASLPNPSRDAETVAGAIRKAGFVSVRVVHDLGFDAMRRTLRDFAAEAEKADWAVVYYAGHGIEIAGQNYLIPVDAKLKSDRDVTFEAVALDQVLESAGGARTFRLVILDACRDNPFIQQMTRSRASRSIGRGLARVEPEGGTLVAFAAKAGQVALDGEGGNSPFVSALVARLVTPNVEIRRLFGLVRDDVLAATGRKQEPFIYGSLGGDELFFQKSAAPIVSDPPEVNVAAVPPVAMPDGAVRFLGMQMVPLPARLREQYKLTPGRGGVLVTEVEAGSPADEKVSPGDMILQVGAEEVASPQDVQRISEAKSSSTGLVLFLLSNSKGEYRFVAVKAR